MHVRHVALYARQFVGVIELHPNVKIHRQDGAGITDQQAFRLLEDGVALLHIGLGGGGHAIERVLARAVGVVGGEQLVAGADAQDGFQPASTANAPAPSPRFTTPPS